MGGAKRFYGERKIPRDLLIFVEVDESLEHIVGSRLEILAYSSRYIRIGGADTEIDIFGIKVRSQRQIVV